MPGGNALSVCTACKLSINLSIFKQDHMRGGAFGLNISTAVIRS